MDAITIPIQFDILQLWLLSSAIPDDAFSKHEVRDGNYDLMQVSMDYLRRKFG